MSTPTGEQFELAFTSGNRRSGAIITEVAAGLRALWVDGVNIVESYDETSQPPWGSGIVLVPWPNRVRDGLWILDGAEQQLDLTEVERHNAIHGLLRNTAYRVAERAESSITLTATVFPQHGYKFHLETSVTYRLGDDGLSVTHEIVNVGVKRTPVAVGAHPYLCVGDEPIESLTLTLAASTRFEVDDRQNPISEVPVEGTVFDLRSGGRIGDLTLDDGFGGVLPDGSHRLTAEDGRYVELWRDAEFAYVQVFTNRMWPRGDELGLAIALEPMTAPADALNSGDGIRWLDAGERFTASWGIRYSGSSTSQTSPG